MKYLSWILTFPLGIVAIVFAVANRTGVTLNLWPLGIKIEAPLFILVLGSLLVGLIVGGVIAWLSGGAARQRGREAMYNAQSAERELDFLRRKLERGEVAAQRPSGTPPANDTSRPAEAPSNRLPAARA